MFLQKPVDLLAFGVAAMLLSCMVLLSLIFHICKEVYVNEKQHLDLINGMHAWNLDETFILGAISIIIVSMGSSSMVEEEQYIWHFVTSTFDLVLLRKAMKSLLPAEKSFRPYKGPKEIGFQMCSIFVLIVSGRTLRAWHQGGVNWTYLPDISKWLEQGSSNQIKFIQLVSGFLVISLCLFALSLLRSSKKLVLGVGFSFLALGLLVLQHIAIHRENTFVFSSPRATFSVQIIFAILGIATIGTFLAFPWLMPISIREMYATHSDTMSTSVPMEIQNKYSLAELKDSMYVIGWAYMFCWCLLQLLLQQPVNSVPLLLLLVQISAIIVYCSYGGPHQKQWVEVSYSIIL